MQLLQATENDLAEVTSWIDSERACRLWAGPSVSYPICLGVLVEEIEFRETNSYIARIDNEISGFGQILDKSHGVNHLARIIVGPEFRGKGHGFQLLNSLVSIATKNANTITLNVYRSNNVALDMYKKLGFNEDPKRSNTENVFMAKS